jgi:hypothetical protein
VHRPPPTSILSHSATSQCLFEPEARKAAAGSRGGRPRRGAPTDAPAASPARRQRSVNAL